jgi:hypothetical protein
MDKKIQQKDVYVGDTFTMQNAIDQFSRKGEELFVLDANKLFAITTLRREFSCSPILDTVRRLPGIVLCKKNAANLSTHISFEHFTEALCDHKYEEITTEYEQGFLFKKKLKVVSYLCKKCGSRKNNLN